MLDLAGGWPHPTPPMLLPQPSAVGLRQSKVSALDSSPDRSICEASGLAGGYLHCGFGPQVNTCRLKVGSQMPQVCCPQSVWQVAHVACPHWVSQVAQVACPHCVWQVWQVTHVA